MVGDSQGGELVKSEQFWGSVKGSPVGSPAVIVRWAWFHGLGCGKFSISVWLGAPGTRMQFTSFLDRCATTWTRHG